MTKMGAVHRGRNHMGQLSQCTTRVACMLRSTVTAKGNARCCAGQPDANASVWCVQALPGGHRRRRPGAGGAGWAHCQGELRGWMVQGIMWSVESRVHSCSRLVAASQLRGAEAGAAAQALLPCTLCRLMQCTALCALTLALHHPLHCSRQVRITGPAANVMTVRVAVTQKLRERIPGIAAVQLVN